MEGSCAYDELTLHTFLETLDSHVHKCRAYQAQLVTWAALGGGQRQSAIYIT